MSGAINLPGSLLAAQAASYSKGQEVTQDHSKEKAEQTRLLRQVLQQNKAVEQQKKAGGPQKGILA